MKYLSLFSGIGTAEKGIEQAYERANYQYESTQSEQADSGTRRVRDTDIDGDGIRIADHAAFRRNAACIGYAEIDRYASAVYRYHWPETRNYGDATTIICDELPDFDFLVGGFPCQAFSIAGKRKGFTDTRGTLFFEIARILEAKRPGHFLLENVAGLLSHDDGQTFRTIIATLDEIGYDLEWTVINSKHHGVPQNRERVFIIGHPRNGGCGEILSFGDSGSQSDEKRGDTAYCLDANYWKGCNDVNRNSRTIVDGAGSVTIGTLRTHKDGEGFREMQSNVAPSLNARARQDGSQQGVIAIPVLTPDRATKRQNGRRMKEDGEASFTIMAQDRHGVMVGSPISLNDARHGERIYDADGIAVTLTANPAGGTKNEPYLVDKRIRRLTEIECERLQALPDNFTKYGNLDGEIKEISSTQRYKTLGNAMTVSVIEAIVSKMIEKGCF